MTDGKTDQVISADDIDPEIYDHNRRTFRQYRLGHAAGGEDLGTSLYELDPGNRTWPAHYHAGNEEAVYVLDGSLTLWLGSGDRRTEHVLVAGDYVALPRGPAYAHEVEAKGDETARFLVTATMNEPDINALPEDRKVLLIAGDPPGEYEDRYLSKTLDFDAEVPFWVDETETEGDDTGRDTRRDAGVDPDDPPVVSAESLEWTETDRGEHQFRRRQLGAAAGGADLGASLYDLPPGANAWLAHYHNANEEAVYVLAGAGTVVLGSDREEHSLEPGDYVALPAGEQGYHDIRAGGDGLRYLMVSTMNEPDITVYPDRENVGLFAGSAPGGDPDKRSLSTFLDLDAEVDYWE